MDNNPPSKPSGPLAEFTSRPTFQLAIPALDLGALRVFYVDLLGSSVHREDANSLELIFFGGRLQAYKVTKMPETVAGQRGGKSVPVPNFGLLMSWVDWHRAVDHLNYVGITYRLLPTTLAGPDGGTEAWFAITDPSGNCLAFGTSRGD